VKLKEWAMEVAAKATGSPDLPVADSTGIPTAEKASTSRSTSYTTYVSTS